MPECRPGFGPSHGRYGNTRFSTSSVSRTFFALAYGPKYQTPGRWRSRVNITRGYSSATVTAMYGNDLSSRNRTLYGGRWRLTRFCSRWSASTSLEVTIVSIASTRAAICRMPCRVSLEPGWKYWRTRGRSDFAFPTYSTSSFASRRMYTPGPAGRRFSWLSMRSVAIEGQGTLGAREGRPTPRRRARRAGRLRRSGETASSAEAPRRGGRGRGEVRARPGSADGARAALGLPRGRAERGLGRRCPRVGRPAPPPPRRRRGRGRRRAPGARRLPVQLRDPRKSGAPPRVRRLHRGTCKGAAGCARRDRRQRAEPEPLLAAAVRRRRRRPGGGRLRGAARRRLRPAQGAGRGRRRDRRRAGAARQRPADRTADALAHAVHPRPRPRLPCQRPHEADHGRTFDPRLRRQPAGPAQ